MHVLRQFIPLGSVHVTGSSLFRILSTPVATSCCDFKTANLSDQIRLGIPNLKFNTLIFAVDSEDSSESW